MSVVNARLERGDPNQPWGFRLQGGVDFGTPLCIQRVTPGSVAYNAGVQSGDIIQSVGQQPISGLTHSDAHNAIRTQGNSLLLSLKRGGGAASIGYNSQAPQPYRPSPPRSHTSGPGPGPAPFKPGGGGAGGGGGGGSMYGSRSTLPQSHGAAPSAPGSHYGGAGGPPSFGGGGGGGGGWVPPARDGPGKKIFGKLGEAMMQQPAGGRVPVCAGCCTSIRGPFVVALNKSWCPDHFLCSVPHCRRQLIDCGFVEFNGQLYCEKDYGQFLAPNCANCSKTILGETTLAMNKEYHPQCFVCFKCRKSLGGGEFHIEEGKPYCKQDYNDLFQTKCYGCQFPIESGDKWIEALNENWHKECFNCSTCQANLEGAPFYQKNGKPYCKKHSGSVGIRL